MSGEIPNIGNENNQIMTVIRDNGKKFDMTLVFKPRVQGWFMSISSEGRVINNIRVVNSGNILHQFRNLLGFGISCTVDDGREPMFQDDFYTRRALLYYLNETDVQEYSEIVSGQISA